MFSQYWEHPDKTALANRANRKRRLALARQSGTHTVEEWIDLKREFNQRCVRCGTDEYMMTKDHIVPLCSEGYSSDSIANIQPLCVFCNVSKMDCIDWVWFRRRFGFCSSSNLPPGWSLKKINAAKNVKRDDSRNEIRDDSRNEKQSEQESRVAQIGIG